MRIRRPRATRHDLASESRHVRPAALVAVAVILTVALAYAASGVASTNDAQQVSEFTATAVEPDGAPIEAAKSRTGRIAETDPELLGRTDSAPVNVVVKLDYDSVATYEGNIQGLAATSPKTTGKKLKQNEEPSRRTKPTSRGRRGNRLRHRGSGFRRNGSQLLSRRLRRSRDAAAGQPGRRARRRGRRRRRSEGRPRAAA